MIPHKDRIMYARCRPPRTYRATIVHGRMNYVVMAGQVISRIAPEDWIEVVW